MLYISSDTNVWIDFVTINEEYLPFLLPYQYIMWEEAVDNELLSPKGISEKLQANGLQKVDITIDEFYLAQSYGKKYKRLSKYDRMALSIAIYRNITLLSGDMALRKAAVEENVPIIGTLGILDKLWNGQYIDIHKYRCCLTKLDKKNGGEIRLPKSELQKRLREIE